MTIAWPRLVFAVLTSAAEPVPLGALLAGALPAGARLVGALLIGALLTGALLTEPGDGEAAGGEPAAGLLTGPAAGPLAAADDVGAAAVPVELLEHAVNTTLPAATRAAVIIRNLLPFNGFLLVVTTEPE